MPTLEELNVENSVTFLIPKMQNGHARAEIEVR